MQFDDFARLMVANLEQSIDYRINVNFYLFTHLLIEFKNIYII